MSPEDGATAHSLNPEAGDNVEDAKRAILAVLHSYRLVNTRLLLALISEATGYPPLIVTQALLELKLDGLLVVRDGNVMLTRRGEFLASRLRVSIYAARFREALSRIPGLNELLMPPPSITGKPVNRSLPNMLLRKLDEKRYRFTRFGRIIHMLCKIIRICRIA